MFSTSADFDNSYSAVKASSSADSYTVQRTGEDLKTIARNLYGDSNLWYVIADANALSAGQILTIPQAITSIGNTSATFKPFDPNEALGNLALTLQDPPARKATGLAQALVMIVTIIVAVIATVLTAGMASPLLQAAVVAVASNVAGQLTAMATGLQSKFDWGAVGEAAVMAVLTAGIGDFSMGKSALAQNVTNGMARQAITATGSELINVSKGKSSSWSNVAKSAVVGGLAAGVVTGIGKAGAGRAVGVNDTGTVTTRTPGQGFSFSHAATTYVTSTLRHAVTERIEAAVYNDDEHQFSWSDVAYRTVHDTLHSSFVNQVAGAPRRQQILFGKDGSGNYVNPLEALRELGSDIMDAGQNMLEFFRGQEPAAVLPGAEHRVPVGMLPQEQSVAVFTGNATAIQEAVVISEKQNWDANYGSDADPEELERMHRKAGMDKNMLKYHDDGLRTKLDENDMPIPDSEYTKNKVQFSTEQINAEVSRLKKESKNITFDSSLTQDDQKMVMEALAISTLGLNEDRVLAIAAKEQAIAERDAFTGIKDKGEGWILQQRVVEAKANLSSVESQFKAINKGRISALSKLSLYNGISELKTGRETYAIQHEENGSSIIKIFGPFYRSTKTAQVDTIIHETFHATPLNNKISYYEGKVKVPYENSAAERAARANSTAFVEKYSWDTK